MLFMRILAQLVDLLVGLMVVVLTFAVILPFLSAYIKNNTALGILSVFLVPLLLFTVQYPFLSNRQTLGKGFFGLRVAPTDEGRKIGVSIMIQREIFCKLLSCYFICIPVLFGRAGGHEEATHTRIEKIGGRKKKA